MKKVLLLSMDESFGGIEKMELKWVQNIGNNVKFNLLNPVSVFNQYDEIIKKNNGEAFDLGVNRKGILNKIKYNHRLRKFLKENDYDIVHINSSVFLFAFQVSLIAKMCRVKKVIVHSHSVPHMNILKKILRKFLMPIFLRNIDVSLSCSEKAKSSLFTLNYINKTEIPILKNGVEIDKYKFNEVVRNEFKEKLDLENSIVYGYVASFEPVKNHEFLIELFSRIQSIQENSVLLLVGSGELKEKIESKVNKLNLKDNVKFLGYREDVNKILNCMDFFIFPSLHEGLGTVAIEAQTNGTITYCSDGVPKEANISPFFREFNLTEDIDSIAKRIISEKTDIKQRVYSFNYTINNGYDIKDVCKELEDIYNS